MGAAGGGRGRALRTLLALCLLALPAGTACPRRCACYGPAELHCTFRYLRAVPPHLPPALERVNLGYNSLLQLTETDFSGLEKLELLMLHSNEINTIPDKVFSDLHSLQTRPFKVQNPTGNGFPSRVGSQVQGKEHDEDTAGVCQQHPNGQLHFKLSHEKDCRAPNVTKCKKDRSSGAQQCPVCDSPKNRKGKSLVDIPSASLACTKPAIQDALKFKNLTVPDDGDFSSISPRDFIAPIGSMILNMTDQAGSRGDLVCNIQKPKEMSPISFDREGNSTVLRTSLSAFLVCGIEYEHIQQLWSILALYSNSPLKLERNVLVTNVPFISYKYKQIYSEQDELFTSIETDLRADPSWLMQSKVALQLDRTATTLNTLHIQYFTDARIILPSADKKHVRNNWTIISRDNKTRTEHTVLVGGTVELECQAAGEPAPAIAWILADGSKVRAPYISEDGRITVLGTGTLTLRTADTFDTGLYHCIGTSYNDVDALTFRITVLDPDVEHNSVNGAQLSASVGSTLDLPCTASAIPDAAVSWVLPERAILHHSVRNKHIFDNGTLRIQGVTERDSGYFRCVAANQYGVDLLVFHVLVRKDKTTLKEKHVAGGEWDEGDGSGNAVLASATAQEHPPAPRATLTAKRESAVSAPRDGAAESAHEGSSYGRVTYRHYRDKPRRRFRGHRRQFVSSARRVDPQRWAAFLEKTKKNSTLVEKQEVASKPPVQVRKLSEVPGDEEEASGDLVSPEEEFMIPVTETAAPGRAMESLVTAGPEVTTSNTPARKSSLLAAEAVTPLPSPSSQSVSSGSRRPQTSLKPTTANSREGSDLSHISANGIKISTASNGASRTSTLFPVGLSLVQSGVSNNQHLKLVSTTPMTDVTDTSRSVTSQNAVEKQNVVTESADNISTKTDHQVPVVTVSEPSPELGPIYSLNTQKRVTPKLPLALAIVPHQQIQIIQDATTHTPQAQQQYGRQRKISGRRRIVRPGYIASTKEHRYNFGRPGSARGSTAVAPDVQPNIKDVSNLPTSSNLGSSINPFSPEVPLSSPSAMTAPPEHPAGTHQDTALLGGEENEPGARQKATTTVWPFFAKGTQDTAQWRLGSSAPLQTNADRVQPFSTTLPAAIHPAQAAAGITHPLSTETASAPESVSPSVKPQTSPQSSQRGEMTWEHLSGNGAQKEVLKKLEKQQRETLPSTEMSAVLPETTAALSLPRGSPLHFLPLSAGGNHSNGSLSLNKLVHYGNSDPTATKGRDVTSLEPTVAPIIAPQSDTKITKSKIFRVGRKRGQRRRRPPKMSTPSVTAGHSAAAVPPVNTAPSVATTARSVAVPASPTPTKPPPESWSVASGTAAPAPRLLSTPAAAGPGAATATRPPATPLARRHVPAATRPPDGHVAQSPATPGPARQGKATARAGERKTEHRAVQGHRAAQPALPASAEPSARPAAPLPAPLALPGPPPWQEPPAAGSEQGSPSVVRTRTRPKSSQDVAPSAARGGREEESAAGGRSEPATADPIALDALSRNNFAKPRIIGGKLAAFTVLADSDAFIPCEATGNPRPTIQWTKVSPGTEAPEGRGEGRWRVFTNGTLAIARAGLGDRGQYLCTAANPLGTAQLLATLSVVAYPPRIAGGRWRLLTAHSGKAAAVTCRAEGRPPPTITWVLANKTHVSDSSVGNNGVRVEPDGTLIIEEATVYDRGLYTCVAKNPAGTDTLVVKLQVVAAPPAILEEKRERVEGTMGENLKLPCTVTGNPRPAVHWVLFDGTAVKPLQFVNGKLFLFANGSLHLSTVAPADSGNYECIATSSTGSDRRVVTLVVERRDTLPKIATASREVTRLNFGDQLLLNCTATGEPKPRIIWRLPSKAVVDQWHR
ncbi:immunoglobulin superfamily member 10-like [Athene noctua]|uniref:immunoglobulin superfamily member 10-like n=1 Tax=Athene noctua TaxID=126797 RepID=UPI003EBE5A31